MKAFREQALLAAICVALGTTVLAPATAQAGWYFGAGAGNTQFDDEIATDSDLWGAVASINPYDIFQTTGNSDTGWKVFGGYQFNQYLAFEGQYADFGSVSAKATGNFDGGEGFTASNAVDVTGWGVNVVGTLPFLEHFAAMLKVGAFRWDSEQSKPEFVTTSTGNYCAANPGPCYSSDDGTDLNFGAGVKWFITDTFAVQVEWENYKISSNDLQLFSGSVSWGF